MGDISGDATTNNGRTTSLTVSGDILPDTDATGTITAGNLTGINIGSTAMKFAAIYAHEGIFGSNSVKIGNLKLSQDTNGLVLDKDLKVEGNDIRFGQGANINNRTNGQLEMDIATVSVTGTFKSAGISTVNAVTQSSDKTDGALVVKGGAGIA